MATIDEIAFTFTRPEVLISAFVGICVFASVVTFTRPLFVADRMNERMKAVTDQRRSLQSRSRAQLEKKGDVKSIRRRSGGFMSDWVKKLNLQALLEDPNVQAKLVQAGLRGQNPVAAFYFARFALPFAGISIGLIYILFLGGQHLQFAQKLGAVVGGAAVGFYLPNLYLSQLAAKRLESLTRAFPDALDMLLICVESGMSVEVAVSRVAAEVGTASVEMAEELTITSAELSYLPERRQAWENFTARTSHPGVRSICLAMVQSERYGTPVSTALRTLAKENRELRMTNAEKKAASLPAKLTVPMIVFFIPVLFMVIMGPAYIRYKQQDDQAKFRSGSAAADGSAPVLDQNRR